MLAFTALYKLSILHYITQEERNRRSTDERAKRNSIEMEKNWAENGALENFAGKRE